jgi:hypothetical protein
MKIRQYSPKEKLRWDGFVDRAKNGHFMFKRDYMEYHSDRFSDHSLMVFDDKERLTALLPANERDHRLFSHQGLTFGGFVTDVKMRTPVMIEMLDLLVAYAQQAGFSEIIYKAVPGFYHLYPASEDVYALLRKGADLYRCDVSSTIECSTPLAFSTLRKRGVRRAAKEGITVRETTDLKNYFTVLNTVLVKHGAEAVHTHQEMALLQSRFPQNIRLFSAFMENKMVAGVLIYETATVAHAQYIACLPDAQNTGVLDLLFDFLINQTYCNKRYFDFGISTENDGKYLNTGLINQKEGFGARATIYCSFKLGI